MNNYNLTIIYEGKSSRFSTDQLRHIHNWDNIFYIRKITEHPDKSASGKIHKDTTHLLLETIDILDSSLINSLENLKYIGLTFTGWWDQYFNIQILRERNIQLCINKTYATNSVAEATFASLLSSAIIINASGWENVSITDLMLKLYECKEMTYIHIAYPEPKIQNRFDDISNVFFSHYFLIARMRVWKIDLHSRYNLCKEASLVSRMKIEFYKMELFNWR